MKTNKSLLFASLPLLGLLIVPAPASAGFGQIVDMIRDQQPIRSHVDAQERGQQQNHAIDPGVQEESGENTLTLMFEDLAAVFGSISNDTL